MRTSLSLLVTPTFPPGLSGRKLKLETRTIINQTTIMKFYTFLILLFITGALCSCQFNSKNRNSTNTISNSSDGFKGDSLNIEFSESNRRYKINDSLAIELIRRVPEFKQIIDYKYEDSTIFNQLYVESVPTDSDKNWQFKIVQFHRQTGHVSSLMWLIVNANNGNISVWDIPKDTIIPLDTWLKTITRKQL